jgi:hypothetical protein
MESSGKDENAGSSPAKGNYRRALVRRAMNPGYEDVAVEDEQFRHTLDLIKLGWSVVRRAMCCLDRSQLAIKEAGVAVEPESGRFVEAGLRLEWSRSF